ncbi:DUF4230 domain-containing protein [Sphingomonas ginkgonis]|uniref:DUF4230 domain-containing protein n=1 Tax=Sphingomonas ginkgonis TaxID=2315330 RepID=A0A3R9Z5L4_9SPHN|nr:DUF4230 domain-containing protein [Sphingomonas ginkgonis]RST30302.1 DUF4230 domain-containing protein [Sphingomonas ginkgonis]
MEQSRLRQAWIPITILLALLLGLMLGGGFGAARKVLGGPTPETVASSSLVAMKAQNRLVPFIARYVSVTTSTERHLFGIASERTLVLPGTVRYELDLSKLQPNDVRWNAAAKTLSVRLPEVEIAGPEVDLTRLREYGSDGVFGSLSGDRKTLDEANRARAVQDLRNQAKAPQAMTLARNAAREAVERSFAMPLAAAGIQAKVVARFPTDGSEDPSLLDASTPINTVLEEQARRRAAGGE